MILNYNENVVFNEDNHTYINQGGKFLTGVTPILNKLFPFKYANIPAHVLAKAQQYGTLIHSKCQTQDMFNSEADCIEVENYIKIKEEFNLVPLENEYLVSDNENIATMIDNVYSSDGVCVIADIKTTSVIDREALSWQTSIGAYLFELQNPHIKVEKLAGIWIRHDKKEYVPLNRIDDEIIKSLIESYLNDTPFINPLKQSIEDRAELEEIEEIENSIAELKEQMSALEDRKAALISVVEFDMEESNLSKIETSRLTITRVAPSVTVSFDSKKYLTDNPDLDVSKYEKKTTRKGYVKITIKK